MRPRGSPRPLNAGALRAAMDTWFETRKAVSWGPVRGRPRCTDDHGRRPIIVTFVANITFPFRRPFYLGTTRSDVPLSASGPLGGLQLCGPHLTPPIGLGPAGSSFPPPAHPTLGCLAPGNTWPFGFPSRCTILHRPSSGGHPVMNRSPVSGQNRYSVELDKTVENWNDCE